MALESTRAETENLKSEFSSHLRTFLSAKSAKRIVFTNLGLKIFALIISKQTYLANVNILPFHMATNIACRLMYITNSEKTLPVDIRHRHVNTHS